MIPTKTSANQNYTIVLVQKHTTYFINNFTSIVDSLLFIDTWNNDTNLKKIGQVRVGFAHEGFLTIIYKNDKIKRLLYKSPFKNIFYSVFSISCYSDNRNTPSVKKSSVYHGSNTAWWKTDRQTDSGPVYVLVIGSRFPFWKRNPKTIILV